MWSRYVRGFDAPAKTPYGLIVLTKILLFCVLIGLGAVNRYKYVPLLERSTISHSPRPSIIHALANREDLTSSEVISRFKSRVRTEAVLIIAVLLCAAFLRHQIPARHVLHAGHLRPMQTPHMGGHQGH